MRSAALRVLENDPPALLSIATTVPKHRLEQAEVSAIAPLLFDRQRSEIDRLMPVFDNAGIATRYSCVPIDWYLEPHGWRERNQLYLDNAVELLTEAAETALAEAGRTAKDIAAVVVASTTGIATPSLEARNAAALGLRPDVRRVPLFGLGCAGGVSGLAVAARLAAAEPGTRWLFVTIETCSISIRLDSGDPAAIVATALFGDGAAGAVVSTRGPGIARIEGSGEWLWPDTLGIMGWRVEDPGLAVIFDRAIPPFLEAKLRGGIDAVLGRMGIGRDEVGRLCCHPGGARVLTAIEAALDLGEGALDLEREVLAAHGNMSAPTVLFVLEALIARGLSQRTLLAALGPGFTLAALSLAR